MKFIRASRVKRGERQDDQSHYLFHRGAKEQAAHQWVLNQETELAACRVVDNRGGAGDKEVQQDTQNIGAHASLESLPPQQARSNRERNVPSKQHARL